MSLAPQSFEAIPVETTRVARTAFPHSTRVMQMRDHLGIIYDQSVFETLYPQRGKPVEAPGAWPSSRLCNLPKTCLTVRLPTRYAVALTGSMP